MRDLSRKPLVIIIALLALVTFFGQTATANSVVAAALDNTHNHIDWWQMAMWLAGGLALFLYGMDLMVKALLMVAGEQMKNLLAKLTTNRVMGAVTGAGVTAVIQSSSITSVLTVGFVSAGLMSVTQAAGVIMGANLGTTITAQIVAFKIQNFALLMIAVGFLFQFIGKLPRTKAFGLLTLGLGLIFFGMNLMSEGMAPLRTYEPFLHLMVQMEHPFLAIVVGMLFTALIQSSSATIGIVIVMAGSGLITLPAGIALAMGAHVGTTITAMLATIGKSRDALRTALIHLFFNVGAVLIWLPFIPYLAEVAMMMTASEQANVAADMPRQIAHANTLLTLVALLVFLPFATLFVWMATKMVPVIEEERDGLAFKANHLDETFVGTPSVALQAVTIEIQDYQKKQGLFYKRMVALISEPKLEKLSKEAVNLQRFKSYQQEIISYLSRTAQGSLTDSEQKTYSELMMIVHGFESMRTAMEDHIINVLQRMVSSNIKPSATMLNLVGQLTNEVAKAMDKGLVAILENDKDAAMVVMGAEQTIEHLIEESLAHQLKRFEKTEKRLEVFRFEMEIIEGFKQLYSLSKRLARSELAKANAESQNQA
ncbi:Na/Pi cotransporter family protein [Thiomicrorhabdus sp. 6S2-11]|uniref:Na/Pi cotransporter family protein n=1 Tax=Thiomicrorhabdus marina TaxID=2818442 RepID=A0ABS3Q869_9GAMM|nr:Na/Pi cotransporter family protein [Thiomicrorhabdus marina]MBO1928268.1 Na/Pi cotransporter family protein [Thiomicrorhabdus marina]